MSTLESVVAQMQKLLNDANTKTGYQDATLTIAVNRLIAGYGIPTVCSHTNTYPTNFVNDEIVGAHYFDLVCSDCGAVVDTGLWDIHIDDDNDCKCDLCGGIAHDFVLQYVSNGNGTHNRTASCINCGYSYDTIVDEECRDRDNDGKCDACGADMETECTHETGEWTYEYVGDGYHRATKTCGACGEVISTTTLPCEDNDSDGKCDRCGASMDTVCAHTSASTVWSYQGDGTHLVTTVCRSCGETVSERIESCTDSNGDGTCDVCAGALDTGIWSYAASDLKIRDRYRPKVGSANKIVWQNYIGGIGLGAASGNADDSVNAGIYAIPIPASATKLTLTLNDSMVKGTSALLFSGSVNEVTDSADKAVDVVNGQVAYSFAAGSWDYVMFSLKRGFADNLVNTSTLEFE